MRLTQVYKECLGMMNEKIRQIQYLVSSFISLNVELFFYKIKTDPTDNLRVASS